MISLVDITESFKANNVFLLKIKSNACLYKSQDFCKTFKQEFDGKVCAFINILNDGATVFCFENADFEEIEAFLLMNGVSNIFCNEVFANNSQNFLLKSIDLLKCNEETQGQKHFEKNFYPDFKSVYNLISNEFCLPDYNEFVSDLSFRLAHNKSRLINCNKGVVFTGWEDENSAIISTIAVYITNRNSGVGSALLNSLVFDLKQDKKQNIYVYCEEKVTPFYLKNGFKLQEKIFTGKVK